MKFQKKPFCFIVISINFTSVSSVDLKMKSYIENCTWYCTIREHLEKEGIRFNHS